MVGQSVNAIRFSIDGHTFSAIASDSIYIEEIKNDEGKTAEEGPQLKRYKELRCAWLETVGVALDLRRRLS